MPFELLQDFWRGFRSESAFFSYARCEHCDLLYCPTYFTSKQLEGLYSSMPDNTNSEALVALRRTQEGYFREIIETGYDGNRILEVGADIGLLITAIKSERRTSTIDAIEPNAGVHEQLAIAIGNSGNVYSDINQLPVGAKFDLITAIHVVDHLVDLPRALESFKQRLLPGGHLYLVTHNEKSLLQSLLGRRWPPYCLQHPHLFNPRSMTTVLERAGFCEIEIRRTTNHFSVRHLVRVAAQLLGLPEAITKIFPPVVLPLRLGNISASARLMVGSQ